MHLNNWQIFDKSGSPLNWTADTYMNLIFSSDTGKNASGYLITDPDGTVSLAEITNSGFGYDSSTILKYSYVFDSEDAEVDITSSSIINLIDVSIFNPNLSTSSGIGEIIVDLDPSTFIYPSVVYTSAIYLTPVSQGLVETEHLFIFDQIDSSLMRPYSPDGYSLLLEMDGDEGEIQMFTVDETEQTVNWSESLIYDISEEVENTPLSVNVGFRSTDEGVYERKLKIYNVVDNVKYLVGIILVNAESIGEDDRFRTLLANFGSPDPMDFPKLFKETDINEALPDYNVINPKSKHMILEHSEITPYIGTYKGLINAIKWLGYDDIYIREWFKNVKENKKISLEVPYDAKDRSKTILSFSAEERKVLKKLNQLSLNYQITRETGEIDTWGTPLTENAYDYSIDEVFIKLLALKNWLERNIIGVNARIIDITGEGIYYERYTNQIYATGNTGFNYYDFQSLTPKTDLNSELVTGDASINMTLLELENTKISDLNYTFGDFIDYIWDPLDPSVTLLQTDPSYLANPENYLAVGPPLRFPFVSLKDIQWKASLEKSDSGILTNEYVTNPLWIYENEIRYHNILDSSSFFYDASLNLTIAIEKAFLRDSSSDIWEDSIAYSIYPDPSLNGGYIMESSLGVITEFDDYVYLTPDANSLLQYAVDENYRVPLLSFKNFKATDALNNIVTFDANKFYHLDILDGKIISDPYIVPDERHYINFHYDTSLNEQMITLNLEYISSRMPLYAIDPSIYYWADPSGLSGGDVDSVVIDNSIYSMNVNHIGEYNVELFGWDGYNVMYTSNVNIDHTVWIKTPTVYSIIDNSCNLVCADSSISEIDVSALVNNNILPIYDRQIPLQGLTLEYDVDGSAYINVPSITYFQDVPESKSLSRFYNLTERVVSQSLHIDLTIDKDYQEFIIDDLVNVVLFDKGELTAIDEHSTTIVNSAGNLIELADLPVNFILDSSQDMYILNDTFRITSNYLNDVSNGTFDLDISSYTFDLNQTIGLIIEDISTGYSFGSTYRVINVDGNTHTLNHLFPEYILSDLGRYTIKAKHAFSAFTDNIIPIESATEIGNNFKIYLNDDYRQYFLDNTFVMVNLLFDQAYVNNQWYETSDDLINSEFYYYDKPIEIDVSTLVILNADYLASDYLLEQKNVWTIKENISKDIIMKVFNKSVPFVFDVSGYYDVLCESYDKYGNLASKNYEGLINVV